MSFSPTAMAGFFYQLPKNALRCFKGYNPLWYLVAIALTCGLVASGLDWRYFVSTRIPLLFHLLFPAVVLGMVLPIVLPLILLAIGSIEKYSRLKDTAFAVGQAAILAWIISSLCKAFTGRIPPPHFFSHAPLVDISHGFRFGLLRGGMFWGWPSSHTTVAFAMAIALWKLYPDNRIVRCVAVLYALYVGIGVSITIHWLSEFIAGAIIGSAIGAVVGNCFRSRVAGREPPSAVS